MKSRRWSDGGESRCLAVGVFLTVAGCGLCYLTASAAEADQDLHGNASAASASSRVPDEQRLLRRLLRNYDQSARPVFNISQSVLVNFSLTLVQIMDMVSSL